MDHLGDRPHESPVDTHQLPKGGHAKMFGKGRKKKELIKSLPTLMKKIQEEHMLASSDLPEVTGMQDKLAQADFAKFPTLKEKLIAQGSLHIY